MTPEEQARVKIDEKLIRSGWVIQDKNRLNLSASVGVAVRKFPTPAGPADYVLFVDGKPVGIVEAKRRLAGEQIDHLSGGAVCQLCGRYIQMGETGSSGLTRFAGFCIIVKDIRAAE